MSNPAVTYRSLLDGALRLICESGTPGSVSDYEDRAKYLCATFCSQMAGLNNRYLRANGAEPAGIHVPAAVTLTDAFPLDPALIPAAEYYLAAMLPIEENEALSDKFFDLYSDAVATLQASLPMKNEKIADTYHALN